MKKLITLLVFLCALVPALRAIDGGEQRLSREEFRAKQKEFIIKQAGLTKEEAAKFFPLYFELQDKKKKLNDESWELLRKGEKPNTTEKQYEEIIGEVCNNRIAADNLDRDYLAKFKKVIPCKKIYQVQRAETRFHREMLRGMHRKGNGPKR